MATSHAPHEGRQSNGNGFPRRAYTVLGFAEDQPPKTFYELLRVPPDSVEVEMARAITEAKEKVAMAEKDPSVPRDWITKLRQKIQEADCLLDPAQREKYDRKIAQKNAASAVSRQVQHAQESFADVVPSALPLRRPSPEGWMSSMKRKVKKHPWISMAAAGVVGAVSTLFAASKLNEGQSEQQTAASMEQALPENAPEITKPTPATEPQQAQAVAPIAPAKESAPPTPKETVPAVIPAPVSEPPTPPAPEKEERPAPEAPPQAKIAAATPAPVEGQPATRDAVPSDEEQEQIGALMKKNRSIVGKSPEQLIDEVRQSAAQRQAEPIDKDKEGQAAAARYFWLRTALEKAIAAHDLDTALRVLRLQWELFNEEQAIGREEAMAVMKVAKTPNRDVEKVMGYVYHVTRELCEADDFLAAKKFLATLQTAPSANHQLTLALSKHVTKLETAFRRQQVAEHLARLEHYPDDEKANRAVGEYRCFDLGDWTKAEHLRKSGNPDYQDLAQRIDQRATLTAEELQQLAKELADWKPQRPGLLAIAAQCCELGATKTHDLALKAGFEQLRRAISTEHRDILPMMSPAPVTDAQGFPKLTLPTAETVLPPGAVRLLAGSPADLLRRRHMVRTGVNVLEQNGATVLDCYSDNSGWVSFAHFQVPEEALNIVKSGKPFLYSVTFSRTSNHRRADAVQGSTAFLLPLPPALGGQKMAPRHIGVQWDNNTHTTWLARGIYRSGIDPATPYFFHLGDRPPVSQFDHDAPLIREDGRVYVSQALVQTNGKNIRVDATLAERGLNKVLRSAFFVGPMDTDASKFLLREGNMDPPAKPVVGFGAGGGAMTVLDAFIAPVTPQRQRK